MDGAVSDTQIAEIKFACSSLSTTNNAGSQASMAPSRCHVWRLRASHQHEAPEVAQDKVSTYLE